METKYSYSDVWVAQVLLHTSNNSNPASIEDMIMIGDVIEHAIITAGELQSALSKFILHDLVIQEGHLLKLTISGTEKLNPLLEKKLSIKNEHDRLNKLFSVDQCDQQQAIPHYNHDLIPQVFSLEEYENAVKNYQAKATKIVNEIMKKTET